MQPCTVWQLVVALQNTSFLLYMRSVVPASHTLLGDR